jgi:hypothetical protein
MASTVTAVPTPSNLCSALTSHPAAGIQQQKVILLNDRLPLKQLPNLNLSTLSLPGHIPCLEQTAQLWQPDDRHSSRLPLV